MKIITILGARPQFIKAAALSRAIKQHPEIQEIIVHTGQHYDPNMSDVFFEQMQIPRPDHFLRITSKYHGEMTGRMMEGIERVLLQETPDVVLVYGDTNSTLAGAIAARKLNLKLAHVEAGLRSHNMQMPEEINRILADRISDFLFCPGTQAMENLKGEGFFNFSNHPHIYDVGDIMKDVAKFYSDYEQPVQELSSPFALSTIHRAENTDDPIRLQSVLTALVEISKELPVILPLHPRTKSCLLNLDIKIPSTIKILEPVGYLEMVYLLKRCELVITDSGGLQKEAYFFNKPCITTRDQTEWTELVDAGYNQVVGVDKEKILNAKDNFMTHKPNFEISLYGEGNTAQKVIEALLSKL